MDRFSEERAQLCGIFGSGLIALEHFGSTAVPGMMAKPVIDVLAVVEVSLWSEDWLLKLTNCGYEDAGEWGNSGGGDQRSHHLHVYLR